MSYLLLCIDVFLVYFLSPDLHPEFERQKLFYDSFKIPLKLLNLKTMFLGNSKMVARGRKQKARLLK
jgi:hypothetical protein